MRSCRRTSAKRPARCSGVTTCSTGIAPSRSRRSRPCASPSRKTLAARVAEFERDGPDPALHQMVVLGHSQGGLLTKLTAVDAGDRFWRNISTEPFDEVPMSPQTRDMVREVMFVTPLPFVKRVIFLCTPHRGSFLAAPRILRRLIARLVRLPSDLERLVAVRSDHSAQSPQTVAEIRRILSKHLADVQAATTAVRRRSGIEKRR